MRFAHKRARRSAVHTAFTACQAENILNIGRDCMLSNSLLKFAASEHWQVYKEDACVFGTVNGYCITASTSDALTTFFVPVAGIAPENLIELTVWLEKTRFPLVLINYEMTDNFMAIRAKDTAFSGTAAQMKHFLDILTEKLDELDIDPDVCAICGLPADHRALYVGLFCHIHADCIHKVGIDFTNSKRDVHSNAVSEMELLLLNDANDALADDKLPEEPSLDENADSLSGSNTVESASLIEDSNIISAPAVTSGVVTTLPFSDEIDPSSTPSDGEEADDSSEEPTPSGKNDTPEPVPEERLLELAEPFMPYEEAFLSDLAALIAIPSVQGKEEEGAPFGQEPKRALETFLSMAERMGFHTVNVDNVAGYAEMGSGDEMVACVCHLDVVPAGSGWNQDPWELIRDGDTISGRGVIDDKGPALACLYAMKTLKDDDHFAPKRRIRLIVGTNEESGSQCLAHYGRFEEIPVAGFTPDARFPAVYAEKGIAHLRLTMKRHSEDAIKEASAGSAVNMVPGSCEVLLKDGTPITYQGQMAHASAPELGINAIAEAMDALATMFEKDGRQDAFVDFFNTVLGRETDGQSIGFAFCDETGATTVNAGLLSIDENEAALSLDIRYSAHLDYEEAKTRLVAIVEPFDVDVFWESHVSPLYLPKTSPLIRALMDTYTELTGTSGEPLTMGGGTYARTLPNICAFGSVFPGQPEVAHQANEHVKIAELLAGARLYQEALKRLANWE